MSDDENKQKTKSTVEGGNENNFVCSPGFYPKQTKSFHVSVPLEILRDTNLERTVRNSTNTLVRTLC
jgi:hypothetical protein